MTSTSPADRSTCRAVVEQALERLAHSEADPGEMEAARANLRSDLALEEDDIELVMQRLAAESLYLGRHPDFAERCARLDGVSPEAMRQALAWSVGRRLHLALTP